MENEADSILCYKEGLSFNEYFKADWAPQLYIMFSSEAERQNAREICENNTYCMFDLSSHGDVNVARDTLKTLKDYQSNKDVLGEWNIIFL